MPENRPSWELDEFRSFATEFAGESDRAAVILGAAKLDLILFQLLQKVLKPCTSKTDELLEGDSPLGTFSARAMMCHRLGLVDDSLYRAINIVRRIRNSFAHELSGATLTSGAHTDRVRELVAPIKENRSFKWLVERVFEGKIGPSTEFRAAVALIALRLEGAFEVQELLHERNPQTLIPPDWEQGKGNPSTSPESPTTDVPPLNAPPTET